MLLTIDAPSAHSYISMQQPQRRLLYWMHPLRLAERLMGPLSYEDSRRYISPLVQAVLICFFQFVLVGFPRNAHEVGRSIGTTDLFERMKRGLHTRCRFVRLRCGAEASVNASCAADVVPPSFLSLISSMLSLVCVEVPIQMIGLWQI